MSAQPVTPGPGYAAGVGPFYALIPVHATGIAAATVCRMLDPGGADTARVLGAGAPIPVGTHPVLISDTSVYGAMCVESMLRGWHPQVPRPWLVLVADAPAPPAPAARYRIRALQGRVLGVAQLPYLPTLRMVEGPEAALEHHDVKTAAAKLRRTMEGK